MPDFDTIQAKGLLKTFGRTRALGGIEVRLKAGEVTVIEGHNGSGKSTLLSLLALLARPTKGHIFFGNQDAYRHRQTLRRSIGVLGHQSMLYDELSGLENLEFFAGLYNLAPSAIPEAKRRFDIGTFGERPVRTYSRGQLQWVALARALIAEPRLVLLDEPSTGLDTAGVQRLQEVVVQEKNRGAIVAVVTHDVAFADAIADRRIRLVRGKVEA